MGDALPTVTIDKGWWDIIKNAAERASNERPFDTLIAILLTVLATTLGPLLIWRFFRYLELRLKEKGDFEETRRKGPVRKTPSREQVQSQAAGE
jgi:hypothetical protein